ncbi:MAG: hypothetical protein ABL866_00210 [Devosia sp.]
MKIRSLLLGSVAAAGLSTGAFATDLGVETSLDVCDELGLSGLTISSDTNCLQITGEVSYEFNWGDYIDTGGPGDPNGLTLMSTFSPTNGTFNVINNNGANDWSSSVDYWLQFVATASSSFGPATAHLKLSGSNGGIGVNEAWVGVGDTTMLMAGMKGSIFKSGDDEPLNFLGLFVSSSVDAGVAADFGQVNTGGHVIQVVSDLGNGLWIGGGLEDLNNNGTAVGVLSYSDDTISAHISFATDEILSGNVGDWIGHAGLTGTWDMVKFVGAVAFNDDGNYDALGSVSFDMSGFKLAASGEMTDVGEWGVGGSIGTEISDGVSLNLGARYYNNAFPGAYVSQVAAQIVAAVTDEVTLTGEVGAIANGPNAINGPTSLFYGKGEVAWAPGGGFTSSVSGEVNSLGGYKATFKAAKTIE